MSGTAKLAALGAEVAVIGNDRYRRAAGTGARCQCPKSAARLSAGVWA